MNTAAVEAALRDFIGKHRTSFYDLTSRETALLELGALTMASEHYRLAGYVVSIRNPKDGLFAAKLTSRGYPYNFSWFHCESGAHACEIHSNLSVSGAHKDGAIYVVDVAVVEGTDAVPKVKPRKPWAALPNSDLATFAEVKKLVVYPMLLAQFVGIVHEIAPKSLRKLKPAATATGAHFPPSLVTLGYLQGTSAKVLRGFAKRGYRLSVVHNFDVHLAAMRGGSATSSPFTLIQAQV